MITFPVDDVEPAAGAPTTVTLGELVGDHVALGLPAELRVLPVKNVAPLIAAVHHAFVEHRPLVLSPDAIWLTIAAGVAQHVRLHAAELRPRLVRHGGRKTLEVPVDTAPADAAGWAHVVGAFRGLVAEDAGAGLARLFTCDFSTSTEVERLASEIVLMDAMSPYYVYLMSIVCGIPAITLTGTVDDWRAIRARIDVIDELELGFWTASLAPIVDRLIAAADGRADPGFFRAIYKPEAAYGADVIAGWIARLYPYVRGDDGQFTARNPLLAVGLDDELPSSGNFGHYDGPGIGPEGPPSGPSRAVVVVRDLSTGACTEHELEGGLLAVELDAEGRVGARAGWLVRPASVGDHALVARLRREHSVIDREGERVETGSQARVLFELVDEARMFDGAWRLLPPAGRERIRIVDGDHPVDALRLLDLPDGTFVAEVLGADRPTVVRMRGDKVGGPVEVKRHAFEPDTPDAPAPRITVRPTLERVEAMPVLGATIQEVLHRALVTGGALPVAETETLLDRASQIWDSWYHAWPLLERLRADGHELRIEPAEAWGVWGLRYGLVSARLTFGATTWQIVCDRDRGVVQVTAPDRVHALQICAESDDGYLIAWGMAWGAHAYVLLRRDRTRPCEVRAAKGKRPAVLGLASDEAAEDIPVIGRSFTEVLDEAHARAALPASRGSLAAWVMRASQ